MMRIALFPPLSSLRWELWFGDASWRGVRDLLWCSNIREGKVEGWMPNSTKNRFLKQNCMTTTFKCPKRGVMLFSNKIKHHHTMLNQLSHGSAETWSKHFRTHLLHPISVPLNHCGKPSKPSLGLDLTSPLTLKSWKLLFARHGRKSLNMTLTVMSNIWKSRYRLYWKQRVDIQSGNWQGMMRWQYVIFCIIQTLSRT